MNGTATAFDLLQRKYAARLSAQQDNQASSIELKLNNNTNYSSIELPEEIKSLITASGPDADEWIEKRSNRYKRLISEGYLQHLLQVAKEARERKDIKNPAFWFAAECGVKYWARTLKRVTRVLEIIKQAAETMKHVGTKVAKFVYKQLYRGINTIRWAALAAETPHDKPNQDTAWHFMWLCKHDDMGRAGGLPSCA